MSMFFRKIICKIRGEQHIQTLVKRGLKIGKNVFINFGCIIDDNFCWLVEIGDNVTLAPNVHILAHDASTKRTLGYTKIGKVKIGNDVFIGAGTIILPGVTIDDKVVIGSGCVVTKNIPSNSVAVGNPAKVICSYDEYIEKQRKVLDVSTKFPYKPNLETQEKIKQYLQDNNKGFIE